MSLLNMTLFSISCRVWVILTSSLTFLGFQNPFLSHLIYPIVIMTFDPMLSQMIPNYGVV